MASIQSLESGVLGACVLTLIHETARRFVPHAPRMDVLGMRALAASLEAANEDTPRDQQLHAITLIGDLVANSLYYSLVGSDDPETTWRRGALLGLAAGIGAVVLPKPLGLGPQPDEHMPETQLMTIGWYVAGGLAAAAAHITAPVRHK